MKKLKFGVIGAGGIADRRTIPGMMLSDKCELVAIMTPIEEEVKSVAQKYNCKNWYTTEEELLKNPEVEAVYIASPVNFHKKQAFLAAESKKPILCEKPLGLDTKESLEILNFAEEKGVIAASGLMMRFHSLHQKMKEIVASGEIGQIVSCRAHMSCWCPDSLKNWRFTKKISGGGALLDMGIHCIDLLEFITGQKIKKATGFCDTKTFNYEVEDSASFVFQLEKGAFAYVDTNFNMPDDSFPNRIEILGTKGSLIAENTVGQEETGNLKFTYLNEDRLSTKVFTAPQGNLYTKELDSFAEAVFAKKEPEISLQLAIRAQRVVEAAYLSAEKEKTIEIKE